MTNLIHKISPAIIPSVIPAIWPGIFSVMALTATFGLMAPAHASNGDSVRIDLAQERIVEPMKTFPAEDIKPLSVEAGFSSWVPGNFTLPSNVNATSSFGRGDLPSIYLNTTSPLQGLFPGLRSRLGLNFVQLNRTGTVDPEGNGSSQTQTIDLFSARIGLEYTPSRYQSTTMTPYASVALLPSFAAASRSSFDTGTIYFGIPAEVGVGARVAMRKLGIAWSDADLDLGIVATEGVIDHSNIAGLGVNLGVRILL